MTLGTLFALCVPSAAQSPEPYAVPHFRFVTSDSKPPALAVQGTVRLLADADFAPFSFSGGGGPPAGLSVELALEACREAGLACEVLGRPWPDLLAALAAGEGDAVISGPRLDERLAALYRVTRPYYKAMGRIAVRRNSEIKAASDEDLAGKRVGVEKGSVHAAWFARHVSTAPIEFATLAEALEALRTGEVDAVFADSMMLIFWKRGEASRGCCALLPGAFFDDGTISPAMGIAVRRDADALRAAFDYGLDRAQANGAFAGIFRRYVPESPW